MESKEYPTSLTSQSTPSDQQSDTQIILEDKDLPPVDGGPQAWLFLIASAMLEALVWGRYQPIIPRLVRFELTYFRLCICVWDLRGLLQHA